MIYCYGDCIGVVVVGFVDVEILKYVVMYVVVFCLEFLILDDVFVEVVVKECEV